MRTLLHVSILKNDGDKGTGLFLPCSRFFWVVHSLLWYVWQTRQTNQTDNLAEDSTGKITTLSAGWRFRPTDRSDDFDDPWHPLPLLISRLLLKDIPTKGLFFFSQL